MRRRAHHALVQRTYVRAAGEVVAVPRVAVAHGAAVKRQPGIRHAVAAGAAGAVAVGHAARVSAGRSVPAAVPARIDHQRHAVGVPVAAHSCAIDHGATVAHAITVALGHQAAQRVGARAVQLRPDRPARVRPGALPVAAEHVAVTRVRAAAAALRVRGAGARADAGAVAEARAGLAAVAQAVLRVGGRDQAVVGVAVVLGRGAARRGRVGLRARGDAGLRQHGIALHHSHHQPRRRDAAERGPAAHAHGQAAGHYWFMQ